MKRFRLFSIGLRVLSALLIAGTALATTYRQLELAEILANAELGFVGTVASVRPEMRDGQPWTVVEFEVERLLRGSSPATEGLRLSFLGGDAPGDAGLRVNLMPTFEFGERVLILAYEEEYYSPIVGFNQGLWRVRQDGLVDEAGRRLSLGDDGRLSLDGEGEDPELVIDAVARELEAVQ